MSLPTHNLRDMQQLHELDELIALGIREVHEDYMNQPMPYYKYFDYDDLDDAGQQHLDDMRQQVDVEQQRRQYLYQHWQRMVESLWFWRDCGWVLKSLRGLRDRRENLQRSYDG